MNKEFVDCLLCGKRDFKRFYPSLPFVVRCSCGLVFANPRLTKDAAADFYSKSYFENHTSHEMGYDNYVSDKELVEKTFRRRLAEIENKWIKKPGKVLDVGCATGFFLSIARQMGWEVSGVEISGYCCDYALREFGLELHQGFFKEARDFTPDFDLITMWDYLEHSFTPDEDLRKAHELLKPGGLLALATPDVGSVPAKIFRENWMGFKEHEHLYYFDKKNLVGLLQAKGFRVLTTTYAGKHISPRFFSKRLSAYSKILSAAADRIASLPFLADKSFYCNPFDILYVVAQKPPLR